MFRLFEPPSEQLGTAGNEPLPLCEDGLPGLQPSLIARKNIDFMEMRPMNIAESLRPYEDLVVPEEPRFSSSQEIGQEEAAGRGRRTPELQGTAPCSSFLPLSPVSFSYLFDTD